MEYSYNVTYWCRGYFAPEYGRGGPTSVKCDIYSLGVIILELVTGLQDIPDKTNVRLIFLTTYIDVNYPSYFQT